MIVPAGGHRSASQNLGYDRILTAQTLDEVLHYQTAKPP